jgi:isoleucyl-tRNA synthetase
MARAIKDIFCRYKTLKGFQVKRKADWDTHGLPVELGVEKELGITKEDIGTKISVEDYNKACKEAVMRYTDIWNDLTLKMGYWVDMEDPYVTYDSKYMESVWWLIGQLFEKNLLYKGYTIQPYSPAAGTGLSSHELNQPGCYQDVTDTTVVAQFKIKNENKYFLAWTTTPWTLPSNTALCVGPKIDYVTVQSFNQYTFEPINVILAKNLLNAQFSKGYAAVEDEKERAVHDARCRHRTREGDGRCRRDLDLRGAGGDGLRRPCDGGRASRRSNRHAPEDAGVDPPAAAKLHRARLVDRRRSSDGDGSERRYALSTIDDDRAARTARR